MNFSARAAIAPSGFLTVAQVRLVLANRDLARAAGGALALRWDDIGQRDPDILERIRLDLRWLGVSWDAEFFQSERGAIYEKSVAKLQAARRLYPCFENDDELRAKRERRARVGKPVVYDRAMLRLTPEQRAAAEANGKLPYWRFLLSDGEVTWKDAYLARQQVKLRSLSDPVLVRFDGTVQPSLAAAIDDIDLGIGMLVRGVDEIANSGIQQDIRAALGANPGGIALGHLPALIDADKGKRARALEKLTVRQLRQDGIEAAALVAYLTDRNAPGATDLRFDTTQLLVLNRLVLAKLSFEDVAARLPAGADAGFWNVIKGNIDLLPEARIWWDVVQGEIVPPILDGADDLLARALNCLPAEPWDAGTWLAWVSLLGPGDAEILFVALTGEEQGPPMPTLLPLIGRDRAARRLRALSRDL